MSDFREKLAGRRVVASVSGGKDSSAMSLWLTEHGIEHDRVFADTGWEADVASEVDRLPGEPLGDFFARVAEATAAAKESP